MTPSLPAVSKPKHYKATNSVTGGSVEFNWTNPTPPTQADVDKIADQQRQDIIKSKQQRVDQEDRTPFMEKLLLSPITEQAVKFMKNFEWKPLESLIPGSDTFGQMPQDFKDIGAGTKELITGHGTEQNPRLAGAVKLARGALGTVGPPLLVAGMATAPEITGPAMAASTAASGAAHAVVPPDWSPEAREATEMGAGLVTGLAAGGGMHKLGARFSMGQAPPIPDTVTDARTGETTRTGVNYNEPARFSQRQLPPGPVQPPTPQPLQLQGAPPPPPPPVDVGPKQLQGPTAPTPQQLPPAQGSPQLAQQQSTAQLPRGPIQMGPTAPIQQGPGPGYRGAGYNPRATLDEAAVPPSRPPMAGPAESQGPMPAPQGVVKSPMTMAPPIRPIAGPVAPPLAQDDVPRMMQSIPAKPIPPVQPPSDLVSARQQPISVTDVSTVEAPTAQAPALEPAPAPPPPQPPVAPPPTAQPPITPQPVAPPQQPPPPMAGPQPIGPVPQANLRQVPGRQVAGPQLPQVPPPQMPQGMPPPSSGTGGVQQRPGPVQNPGDIVRAALAKRSAPEQSAAPQIDTMQQAAAKANNDVLDLMKTRRNVTPSQIQNKLGLPGDQVKPILDSLQKRGLVTRKGSTYNYNRMASEELPPEQPEQPPVQPEQPQQAPEQAPKISPARTQRISDLHNMIGEAEDENNDYQAEVLRGHLQTEEKAAEIERSGTPEQKAQLHERDSLTDQAKALEEKDEQGTISPEEARQLGQLYKKINALEINDFFQSEEGSSPSVNKRPGDDLNRPFFSRWAYAARNIVPPPGFADIRGLSADLGSPNRVLRDSGLPGAVDIGRGTPEVEVKKYKWLGTILRKHAAILKGLSDAEMKQVARALDVPGAELGHLKSSNLPPKIKQAAVALRQSFDKIFLMFPEDVKKSGGNVGYLSGYLPHIANQFKGQSWFSSAIDDAAQYHLGALKGLTGLFTRDPVETPVPNSMKLDRLIAEIKAKPQRSVKDINRLTRLQKLREDPKVDSKEPIDINKRGIADPSSPHVEERTGQMRNYSTDLKRILPMYVKLAAKVIFDKPWIDEARVHLARIPEDAPQARNLAEAYLKNYADTPDGYDAVRGRWDQFTGPLMRAHARSLLGLSTRLFSLHGARLLSQIYPEVPTKYFAQGALETIKDPIGTYQELGRRGVLPANTVPWIFERPAQKFDRAILQGFSMFDFVPDAVGWHGLLNMYLDQGHDPVTAGNMASDRIMDLSMRSTPARMQNAFNYHGFLRPLLQYKQQILKIFEQYATQPADAIKKGDYGRLGRYIIGVGATLYLGKKFGIITAHLGNNLLNFGGGAYGTILSALKKGAHDPAGALQDLVTSFGIPASHEAKSIISGRGPTVIEHDTKGHGGGKHKSEDIVF